MSAKAIQEKIQLLISRVFAYYNFKVNQVSKFLDFV